MLVNVLEDCVLAFVQGKLESIFEIVMWVQLVFNFVFLLAHRHTLYGWLTVLQLFKFGVNVWSMERHQIFS